MDISYAAPTYYREDMHVPGREDLNPEKSGITSITFLDALADMPADTWDASQPQNGSVMAWLQGTDLYIAGEGGVTASANSMFLFAGYVDLISLNFNGCFHTEQTNNMGHMFEGLNNLQTLDLSGFDTSNVTDMSFMFVGCKGMPALDLSGFNTSKVENMCKMFSELNMESLDLSSFDTSSVIYMKAMFQDCRCLTNLDLKIWDTTYVEDMASMFDGCVELTNLEVGEWEVDSVENRGGPGKLLSQRIHVDPVLLSGGFGYAVCGGYSLCRTPFYRHNRCDTPQRKGIQACYLSGSTTGTAQPWKCRDSPGETDPFSPVGREEGTPVGSSCRRENVPYNS